MLAPLCSAWPTGCCGLPRGPPQLPGQHAGSSFARACPTCLRLGWVGMEASSSDLSLPSDAASCFLPAYLAAHLPACRRTFFEILVITSWVVLAITGCGGYEPRQLVGLHQKVQEIS